MGSYARAAGRSRSRGWPRAELQRYRERAAGFLQKLAKGTGIELVVDDEFDLLMKDSSNVVPITQPRFRKLPRLSRVVRLTPSGSCSVGEDILRHV